MFLIIPLVEFLHVLGVDINVHHENPATFLCHVPGPHARTPGKTRDTNWGAISVNTESCIACRHTCRGGRPGHHVGAAARSRLSQGILGAENDAGKSNME